ncbi:flavin reductase family protein [Heliobacterium gestii]|uniref:Flavin reductase family protein n=1 Tax=Heliomicrobium gestii TaxID=2699 RepID=A0A845LMR1_HELGE|nr:flavin reductase family protein [Heliomicrobium gestii]MBM7868492.1 flavin reductase (DIM6/NTAB) family NADH-FMN oxidoreductase RutF [Heliomicrobium gestii]MZP44643.1 flavin reductase family protein [Heliomicrobium gestii]
MKKTKIANIPYGPYIAVLAGATVDGKANYATLGAYGVVSQRPVLYISLKNSHYTTKGVLENGFFSVNIPSSEMIEKTDYCGTVSGHKVDKSEVFESFYDEAGNAPMIKECPVNYLCKVIDRIPIFDFTMFLGEIVAAYANEDCLENGRPNALKVKPTMMMAFGYFDIHERIGSIFQACKGSE